MRGRPTAKNSLTAGMAVAVVGACLLASGALDPLLGDAVTFAEGLGHGTPSPAAKHDLRAKKVADWQYFDNEPEWSTLRGIPAVDPPAQPAMPSRPAVAPPENPIHFHFSAPPPMRRYTLKPMTSCPQPRNMDRNVELLTVTPGTGSATVTWWDLGDQDTVGYQLEVFPVGATGGNPVGYAAPSATNASVFINVTPPKNCQNMSVTVPNLKTGSDYQFFLLATNQAPEQSNRKYQVTRGRTRVVTIL